MPDIVDLVVHLSGLQINDNNRRRASTVAGHLAASVYKEAWNQLSESKKQLLVRNSTDRIWNNYMQRRTTLEQSPKEV